MTAPRSAENEQRQSMDFLERAKPLLQPYMGEDPRDSSLALAFHGQHRDLYDNILQRGSTRDFTIACVRTLLGQGCVGPRQRKAPIHYHSGRRGVSRTGEVARF
jgi:hypothetical protein